MTARTAALALAIAAWCCFATAAIVSALGAISLEIIALSISGPTRLFMTAALLLGTALFVRGPRPLLHDLGASPAPYAASAAFAAFLLVVLLATRGAVSVGGADSAGYLAQAARWNAGAVRVPLPLDIAGLPDAAWRQSGLGFRPAPDGAATVPIYPPGLPWLQAVALRMGGEAAAVRTLPLLAALAAIAAAYALALPHGGAPAAALTAIALASAPPFLFQALQPMSDVPALAAWLLALALAARSGRAALVATALATFVAIAIRPNLAPLALPVCWQAYIGRRAGPSAWRAASVVLTGASAAIALVAAAQHELYGSALQSGYGGASELFAITHLPTNVARYTAWLHEAFGPPALALLVVGALLLTVHAVRDPRHQPMLSMAVLTIALYLVYVPFDSWTYLRFMLIALAILPVGVTSLLQPATHAPDDDARGAQEGGAGRWSWRFPMCCASILIVAIPNLQRARQLGVFDVRSRELRYEAAGTFVRDRLPGDAVIVAAQHSASASYYSGRPVVRLDLLDPAAFATIAAWSVQERRPLAFVLDVAEVEPLAAHLVGALDWPPRAEIGRPVTTRIWLSTDRDAYRSGEPIGTTRITATP